MTVSNFLVGPITDGLSKNKKPWLNAQDAFEVLTNAYQWRGRIVRRQGYSLLAKLANGTPVMGLKTKEDFALAVQSLVAFDTTNAYVYNSLTKVFDPLPSVMPTVWSGTNYQFFVTANYANAFWATNSKSGLHGVTVTDVTPGLGFSTIATSVPNGFSTGQTVTFINLDVPTDLNGNTYVITVVTPITFTIPFVSTGGSPNRGIALNSYVSIAGQDGIRYYGILTNNTGWANYNPPIDTRNALTGALFIFPYRGYLVFLSTIEGNDQAVFNYKNRARWTQIGTPYYSEPVPTFPNPQGIDPLTMRDDLFGHGGASDAPTNECIVGAAFIRDIVIVYFERSTWRLRFVNNAQNPFVWERVNVELGSSCSYSTITFDKGAMAISNRGIVICDANDTIRFDEKIPDEIFNIRQKNNGLQRVYGIRTFRTRLNYWTYPSSDNPMGTFPDKVLVFNYETQTWAFFDDTFTCFGYYYPSGTGFTWADLTDPWSSYDSLSWNSGVSQEGYETILAGNQQGYVFTLEQTTAQNAPSLSISAILNSVVTSTDHNLTDDSWITLSGVTGTTSNDGVSLNGRNFQIGFIDANNFNLNEYQPINGGLAVGGAYIYDIDYQNILRGSIQINIGALVFTDPNNDGVLVSAGGSGTINYETGRIVLAFSPVILSTQVWIRVVTLDPLQGIQIVPTTGAYTGGGEIAKISNIDIQTKEFNFFNDDQRARLSKVDFYVDTTANGQFTCNVWSDSSNNPVNTPLSDNPLSNVVLTTLSPNQYGDGEQTMYRLYCDAIATTIQLQLTLSNAQMAVSSINKENIEIQAMNFSLRKGGRLV